jgi:hypothetical protein
MDSVQPSDTADPPDPRGSIAGDMAMLRELAEIGMRLARRVEHEAMNPPDPPPAVDPVIRFERAAKAVRLTVALRARLEQGVVARERKARLIRSWRVALKGYRPWERDSDALPKVLEKLIETEADPDEIEDLLIDLRDTLGRYTEEDREPGLSAEMVEAIKREVLGIREPIEPAEPMRPDPAEHPGECPPHAGRGPPARPW